jgi:toxin ParE1/3/4
LRNAARGVARVKLSAAARRDLAKIDEYSLEQFGDEVASAYSRGFNDVFGLLGELPLSGQARPDYREGTRCKMHKSHRILYRVDGETVLVQRILHHSQNVPAHLKP